VENYPAMLCNCRIFAEPPRVFAPALPRRAGAYRFIGRGFHLALLLARLEGNRGPTTPKDGEPRRDGAVLRLTVAETVIDLLTRRREFFARAGYDIETC